MPKRMIYVIPLVGLVVRVPKTKAKLPPQGAWVPAENYWLRRISDGSVREAEPPQVITEKPEEVVPDNRNRTWEKRKRNREEQ